jgi:Fe-S oxidoreductase
MKRYYTGSSQCVTRIFNPEKDNKFNHKELYDVLSCVCKACASECPSNVDVAALKSEFLYQYQRPMVRCEIKFFANNAKLSWEVFFQH